MWARSQVRHCGGWHIEVEMRESALRALWAQLAEPCPTPPEVRTHGDGLSACLPACLSMNRPERARVHASAGVLAAADLVMVPPHFALQDVWTQAGYRDPAVAVDEEPEPEEPEGLSDLPPDAIRPPAPEPVRAGRGAR
jgi:hypothetical protein